MPNQEDRKEFAHLEEVNAELTRSLDRCRELLVECREKLAANSNDPEAGNDEEPPAIRMDEDLRVRMSSRANDRAE